MHGIKIVCARTCQPSPPHVFILRICKDDLPFLVPLTFISMDFYRSQVRIVLLQLLKIRSR